ncbi:MAG: ribonuclease P protein component [Leptolyngbya sp. SIO1E4]|nr:ribonuclease P protein component [Leptolyngbya sp. SIO1E4]
MALPRQYRLTHNRDFSKVYRFGKQAATNHLAVKVLTLPEQFSVCCSRFGITVSQKVSKRSVVRNRLKRQVRAALQALIPHLKSGLWIVVILRAPAIECDYWQFLRELKQLFSELEVFHGY